MILCFDLEKYGNLANRSLVLWCKTENGHSIIGPGRGIDRGDGGLILSELS